MVLPKLSWESIDKIMDKLTLIGSGFLLLGSATILLSIYVTHENGLKFGILTLIFGAIFRLYNGLTKSLFDQLKGKKYSFYYFAGIIGIRFVFWFALVIIYGYLVNGIIQIIYVSD